MQQHARTWLPAVVVLGLALIARYAWIEPAPIGLLCVADSGPWWCSARQALIMTFATQGLGYAAIVSGTLALLSRSRRIATVAACLSVAGLVLYCHELSAVGLVLSVLTLARVSQAPQTAVGP